MKKMLPVAELARDERFQHVRIEDTVFDPRNATDLAARMKEVFAAADLVGFDASTERRSLDSYGLLRRDFARDFLDMAIPGPPPIKEPGLAPGAELPR